MRSLTSVSWTEFWIRNTVDHNIFAARKFRESAPMYIFATQNFRECPSTSTKKKNHDYPRYMQKKAAVYNNNNNAICYGSTFVKATGGVPVDLYPWTQAVDRRWKYPVKTLRRQIPLLWLYSHQQVCRVFDDRAGGRAAIGLWKHCYVKRLAVPAGGPVWLTAVKWCSFKLFFLMLKQRSYFTSCKAVLIKTPQDMLCLFYDSRRSPLLHLILPIGSLLWCTS